jgi:hypothetical protein
LEQYSPEKLSETFLCRLTNQRIDGNVGDISALKARLISDVEIDDEEFTKLLLTAQEKKIIKVELAPAVSIKITDKKETGVQRLMRKFCKRYYGEVSPLIDRKTIQAVLRRYGADFDLDNPEVIAELRVLEDEGLIRLIQKDHGFLKLLGSE